MIKPALHLFVTLGVLSMVTACQTLPKLEDQDSAKNSWLNHHDYSVAQPVNELNSWRYNAKISIKTDSLKEAANLVWLYSDQSNQLRIFGPLGAGAIKLQFDRFGVELTDSKGIVHRGKDPEILIYDLLGWAIPINSMSAWLFGQPDKRTAFRYQVNDNDHVALIQQNGWQIEYTGFRDYSGRLLPRKIKAIEFGRDSLPSDVEVLLVSKGWSFAVDDK